MASESMRLRSTSERVAPATCVPGLQPVSETQTPEGGIALAAEHPVYLQDPVLDATVRMLVELSAQVWIERERRLTLEALLETRGLVTREAIEQFTPDEGQRARVKAERDRFIEDVFKELRRIPLK